MTLSSSVFPWSPAAIGGLTSGLIIQKVDGIDLSGLPLAECTRLIRGIIGTKVTLELFDPQKDETTTVELTRQKIKL